MALVEHQVQGMKEILDTKKDLGRLFNNVEDNIAELIFKYFSPNNEEELYKAVVLDKV